MSSHSAKKVVSIYSIVFGSLGFFGAIGQLQDDPSGMIFSILLIVSGILLLIPSLKPAEKGLIIGCLVYYSLLVLAGLILFFIIPFIGIIIWVIAGVPFAFSIVFLAKKSKEINLKLARVDSTDNLFQTDKKDANYVEKQLIYLQKMVVDGLITPEDYEKKKKVLLEIE